MTVPEKKDVVVDMLSWIIDGNFAGIFLNDPKLKVLEKLGPPAAWEASGDWYKKIKDYLDADVWGYGVWTILFDNDKLSLISCIARDVEEYGWFFDVINKDNVFKKTKEELCAFFERDMRTRIFFVKGGKVRITNIETGEFRDRYARGVPYLVVGDELRTVIRFFKDKEGIDVIHHPFNIKRQIVGSEKIDFNEKLKIESIEAED